MMSGGDGCSSQPDCNGGGPRRLARPTRRQQPISGRCLIMEFPNAFTNTPTPPSLPLRDETEICCQICCRICPLSMLLGPLTPVPQSAALLLGRCLQEPAHGACHALTRAASVKISCSQTWPHRASSCRPQGDRRTKLLQSSSLPHGFLARLRLMATFASTPGPSTRIDKTCSGSW